MKLLFVCLGNICRSPSGEAVMNALIEKSGLEDQIHCDSAGTYGGHAGSPADSRMRTHAAKRGYDLTSISRKITPNDLQKFDYIIAMDQTNYEDIILIDRTGEYRKKIVKMTDFCSEYNYDNVPDPYYGGAKGFELVLDLLEDACKGLLAHIHQEL